MNGNNSASGYDVRSYNLTVGNPQALPAGREFLIISATVNIQAVTYALGDANGDMEQWPFGFAVGVREGSTKARIGTTVNQTVVVAIVSGDAVVVDSRFAPGAGTLAVTEADGANVALGATTDAAAATDTGNATLIALTKRLLTKTPVLPYTAQFRTSTAVGAAAGSTIYVAAGANVNGILLITATVTCLADPTAEARLFDNTDGLLNVVDSQSATLGSPVLIPAGQQLGAGYTGGIRITGAYRIL
jgi:hypothetical protein